MRALFVAAALECALLPSGACACKSGEACDLKLAHASGPRVVTSSLAGARWNQSALGPASAATAPLVEVDSSKHFQTVLGFGGAFTDASTFLIDELDQDLQQAVVDGYYSPEGLAYTLGRTHMGSVDFSRQSYSLIADQDLSLGSFQLRDDGDASTIDGKVALIRAANHSARGALNKVFFAPWSPPPFMKTVERFHGGVLKPDPEVQRAYAKLFSKFIAAYKAEGVNLWAASAQNEPNATQPTEQFNISFESCTYSAAQEVAFVRDHLGPVLKADHPEVQIIAYNDMLPNLEVYTDAFMQDKAASDFVAGFGYHWYLSMNARVENTSVFTAPLFGTIGGGAEVADLANKYASKFLLPTEACTGSMFMKGFKGPKLGDWGRGYRYARDIYYQLANGAVGWTDWNLVLDMAGGPNHAQNFVDAPILVNKTALYVNPMYFAIGHFSHFVPPGSVRVAVEAPEAVEAVGFVTPAGDTVVVLLNGRYRQGSNWPKLFVEDVTVQLKVDGVLAEPVVVPAQGLQTIVWPRRAVVV